MNIKPLHNNVVIKPADKETVTASGLIIPDTVSKEKPEQGEVIAVGAGRILDNGQVAPMAVKVGDQVMFRKYSPDEVKIDGQEFLIIKESDIMLIV
jgi:chaperonin GroES